MQGVESAGRRPLLLVSFCIVVLFFLISFVCGSLGLFVGLFCHVWLDADAQRARAQDGGLLDAEQERISQVQALMMQVLLSLSL